MTEKEGSRSLINVYVPRRGSIYNEWIAPHSGIVGELDRERRILVLDFEGNIFGTPDIQTFADRVRFASGRHTTGYPTKARIIAEPEEFERAGRFELNEGYVLVDNQEALQRWLGVGSIPKEELFTTGGHAASERYWLKVASETADPAMKIYAKNQAKRYARKQEEQQRDA